MPRLHCKMALSYILSAKFVTPHAFAAILDAASSAGAEPIVQDASKQRGLPITDISPSITTNSRAGPQWRNSSDFKYFCVAFW